MDPDFDKTQRQIDLAIKKTNNNNRKSSVFLIATCVSHEYRDFLSGTVSPQCTYLPSVLIHNNILEYEEHSAPLHCFHIAQNLHKLLKICHFGRAHDLKLTEWKVIMKMHIQKIRIYTKIESLG